MSEHKYHLPFGGHAPSTHNKPSTAKQEESKEESLTTILDEEQRGELTLLIASAMVAMRRTITSSFDANAGVAQDIAKDAASEDEKIMNPDVDPTKADIPTIEAEKKLKEQRQKELATISVKELKEDSLNFFDDWRGKVIERVGEVVNSRERVKSQLKKADPPKDTTYAPADRKLDDSKTEKVEEQLSARLEEFYPPIKTPLAELEEKERILIIHSTLLLLLSLEHYIAPSRVLLLYMTSSFKLPLKVLIEDEEKIAKGLLEAAKQMSGDAEAQKKADENQSSRKWKVGLASVAGAALIGVTGGLAAPLVAAGVGSVMGGLGLGATAAAGYLGTVAGSSVIVGGLFGAYGGRMTGQMMDNYAREVSDFAFIPIEKNKSKSSEATPNIKDKAQAVSKQLGSSQQSPSTSTPAHQKKPSHDGKAGQATSSANRRLRVTIAITGWLTSPTDVTNPWAILNNHSSEPFALRFELEALLNLGNSLDAMVSSAAWGYAKNELIKRTVLAGLAEAAAWPLALMQVGRVVDNPFTIARQRADKAGEVLADALVNKAQGERPVTLIGYSLGARVIYACLSSLAKRKAFGLVESAVLIGAPAPSGSAEWRRMRAVVAGRLVNVFSNNDYVLSFLYRTASAQYGVAGLSRIAGLPGVENVDVSEQVSGHLRYRYLVGSILKKIGWEDIDDAAVKKEEEAFKKIVEEEKKASYKDTAKDKGTKVLEDNPLGYDVHGKPKQAGDEKSPEEEKKEEAEAEAEAQRMEKEVKEKTEKGMLEGAWGYLPTRLRGGGGADESTQEKTARETHKDGKVAAAMGEQEGKKEDKGLLGTISGGYLGSK
ncbi:uncharacterized protein KY384_004543 [Bacidia gigantensis]|uniref:uncharacterized protein n=1 Tax=Bacidia gigantensis TaxID=2732470 RepID=UPI001D04D4B0|nr:uncharacterized protein KY384_004543 [Bacidia gigantensis]KAG8531185.1 hypothetical protein KY384_004543 [Bacidia gigantensis]